MEKNRKQAINKKREVTRKNRLFTGLNNEVSGVTLVALTITIIVMLILTGITIYVFSEEGPIEHAKFAKFATEFRGIEERVELYATAKQMEQAQANGDLAIDQGKLPVSTKLTSEEKTELKSKKPELAIKIMELSEKEVDAANLYWIDQTKTNTNRKERYLIDIDTRQIYQYEGKTIYGLQWHTLDSGIKKGTHIDDTDEIWDGWIRLTLYYPAGSTNRQWRLGEEGETRYDENLMWKDYTGPIWVRLSDVENVWIRYILNGEEQIVPPSGRLAVDIMPDSYLPNLVQSVKVKIYYDKDAEQKEYKIGNSAWMEYQGEFTVTENTIIEARAKKTVNVSDADGNITMQKEIWGRDNVYVGNIGIEESDLPAPTITRKQADSNVENEVAKVEVSYPDGATRKIYKINYGEEKEYTQDISVTAYGTHVIAYYYNAEGKRSKSSQILINNTTTGEKPEGPVGYTPNPPGDPKGPEGPTTPGAPKEPSYVVPAPNIIASPTTIASQVSVKIAVPSGYNADSTYYKIGDGSYTKYTMPFTLNYNTTITSYYTTLKGERSNTARKRINNIQIPGKPYVKLEANPDSYVTPYGASKVEVTITSKDADKVEYSLNGITYKDYTSPIELTTNTRVYAKGTNANGETIEYIDITNIGNRGGTKPTSFTKLSVWIDVTPEPKLTNELVEKATVSIGYDENAEEKYYQIDNGSLMNYTGPFEVSKNCTITAYAVSSNGKGEATKQIDHLTSGISAPQIMANPSNNKQSSTTTITINFDRTANIKRYKINGGSLTDYVGPIEVNENCTITAYNKNKLGYEATSTYTVSNIVKTTTVIIDKGKYYIIKLNYPPESTGREYKWQDDGEWTSYKEDGILLIKPEYKDEILNAEGKLKIKIENEEGKLINFNGDYYFITKSIQELMEHVYLRWSRQTPQAPTIILNTEEPTKEVLVSINYSNTLVNKQYRIIEPDGTSTDWQEYSGIIKVTKKNTVICARGQDEAEVWSEQAMRKITNIDEEPPIIKVTADLEKLAQKVGIKVEAQDDTRVDIVMWAQGIRADSYFNTNGTVIPNNSVFYVTENSYYTIYAKDVVGNTSTYTLQVGNVDLTPPNINITVTPDNTIVTKVTIGIDYGDSTLKQYKIGENNTTWTNYTGEIDLTSNTVLANNWKNSDNTVTIFAKGKDSAGNEQIETYKILNLDVDAPKVPTIKSNYGYPILTEYGVQFDGETTITYDTRSDIDNYYSIDNGKTWKKYTGTFNVPGAGTILAKSVKKVSGLEVSTSKQITMPSDAIGPAAYDGNNSTSVSYYTAATKRIYIDEAMYNKKIGLLMQTRRESGSNVVGSKITLTFFDANNKSLATTSYTGECQHNIQLTCPQNAKILEYKVNPYNSYNKYYNYTYLYEIRPANQPTINATTYYPTLTPNKVEKSYSSITINYFSTSVKKLYKIENEDWKVYTGQTIRIETGQTIYAKGIDKNGNETNVISSFTSAIPSDALGVAAYDGNNSTSITYRTTVTKRIYIDEAMYNKKIGLLMQTRRESGSSVVGSRITLTFFDANNKALATTSYTGECQHNIQLTCPQNAKILEYKVNPYTDYDRYYNYTYLYEIKPVN